MKRPLVLFVLALLLTAAVRAQQPTPPVPPPPPPPLRVHFVDVGQGDGVLIQSPAGQAIVYDAGEDPRRMRDYLVGLGVTKLALVIA